MARTDEGVRARKSGLFKMLHCKVFDNFYGNENYLEAFTDILYGYCGIYLYWFIISTY